MEPDERGPVDPAKVWNRHRHESIGRTPMSPAALSDFFGQSLELQSHVEWFSRCGTTPSQGRLTGPKVGV